MNEQALLGRASVEVCQIRIHIDIMQQARLIGGIFTG